MTSHGWSNGVFIGVDSNRDVHQKMKKYNNNDTRSANTDTGGIVGDPSRIIEANDWLIFISPTSSPSHAYRVDQKKLKAMADVKKKDTQYMFKKNTHTHVSFGLVISFSSFCCTFYFCIESSNTFLTFLLLYHHLFLKRLLFTALQAMAVQED